jgi:sugar phosphate isomerase/epimerase
VAAELWRGSSREQRAAINDVLRQLDAAHLLGVSRFRHDATLGPENGEAGDSAFESALSVLVPACREIAQHAASLGISSSVENHGRFVQHADRVARLVEEVAHPGFGVTLDIGNSLFAPQDPVRAAQRLAPYAITVHVKDFEILPRESARAAEEGLWETYPSGPFVRGSVIGEGDLDVPGCLNSVVRAGFDGPFVVEFEGPSGDPREAARKGVERVRVILNQLASS